MKSRSLLSECFAVLIVALFAGIPAFASGTGYHSGPRAFNGHIAIVSTPDKQAVGDAFITMVNMPTSTTSLAVRIFAPGTAYKYSVADTAGLAQLPILPLGSFVVWKPGFWPEEVKFKFRHGDRLRPDGSLTVMLRPAEGADRAASSRKAAELFGFIKKDGRLTNYEGAANDPSEQVRLRIKNSLSENGGLGAE